MSPGQARIVVVDDNYQNLELLEYILEREGFDIQLHQSGSEALKGILSKQPDLILLDINMPGMSGFELCRKLKTIPDQAGIPVIFISGLTDIEDKKEGFRIGGVDYITKPFDAEEVVARVNTHLLMRNMQKQIEGQNRNLERMVQRRTAELEKANKLLTKLDDIKGEFWGFISHELRTPLNGLIGVIDLLMGETGGSANDKLKKMFDESKRRILALVDDALMLKDLESNNLHFIHGQTPLEDALASAVSEALKTSVDLEVDFDLSDCNSCNVAMDRNLMVKAFKYLLITAHTFCAPGEALALQTKANKSQAKIEIIAKGKSIDDKAVESFFDFYSEVRATTYAERMGLAPVVAAKIISLFDGSVEIVKISKNSVGFIIRLDL